MLLFVLSHRARFPLPGFPPSPDPCRVCGMSLLSCLLPRRRMFRQCWHVKPVLSSLGGDPSWRQTRCLVKSGRGNSVGLGLFPCLPPFPTSRPASLVRPRSPLASGPLSVPLLHRMLVCVGDIVLQVASHVLARALRAVFCLFSSCPSMEDKTQKGRTGPARRCTDAHRCIYFPSASPAVGPTRGSPREPSPPAGQSNQGVIGDARAGGWADPCTAESKRPRTYHRKRLGDMKRRRREKEPSCVPDTSYGSWQRERGRTR